MANPLSTVEPWDIVVDGYVTDTQPIFEKWAEDSFTRMAPESNHKVLDVACGPGTVSLLLAKSVKEITALDFSSKMIESLNKSLSDRNITNVKTDICDCQSLDLEDNSFDLAFSQFGLMFFPNRPAGMSEIHRILKPSGKVAIYSWAPISESTGMQLMIGALQAGFPETKPKPDDSKTLVTGLDDKEIFRRELQEAGFSDIKIESIRHSFPVESAEKFWESMVRGSAPITMMKKKLPEDEWLVKEKVAKQYVRDNLDLNSDLYSTAYLGTAVK